MTDPTGRDRPDDPLATLQAHNARVRAGRLRGYARRRLVRGVSWVVVLVALALIGLGIALRAGAFDRDAATVSSVSVPVRTTAPTTTAPVTTAPSTTTSPATTAAAVPLRFVVRATRGDSWMEIRVGSSTGRVLYSGILRQGDVDHESGRTLWARFGSVGNLDLTVNGRAVRTSSLGTVEATVTPEGLRS